MSEYDYLKCSSCKALKKTSEFYLCNNDRGFRYYCKTCELEKREQRKAKQKSYYKSWYQKNKAKFKKKKISYTQDVNVKMKKNVREFFIDCVKNNKEEEQFQKQFGYAISEARAFESKFSKGMRWTNLGHYWNFYNIIPETAFNFANPDEIKKCWNLKNIFICLNEDYKQVDRISITTIKEKGILELMPEFLIIEKT